MPDPPPQDDTQRLRANPIFARMPAELLVQLLAASALRALERGERVLTEGDPATSVFALVKGAVRVFYERGERQVVAKLFRAPAIFGEAEAFVGDAHRETVEATERSELVIMPVASFRQTLAADGPSAMAFAADVASRLAIAIRNAKSLAYDSMTLRLANFLVDYARWTNDGGAATWRIDLDQGAMAAAIGAGRRSVAIDMQTWQKEGIIERRGRYYRVNDPAALERYADGEHKGVAYSLARTRR